MITSFDLSPEDCARLLAAGVVGRIAFTAPDGPHIVPVNYVVDGESVLVRTAAYSLLGTHARGAPVCFEVDHLDHEHHRGWSVSVRGRARYVDSPEELEQVARSWSPRPWADGHRRLVIRIPWTEVSGRRLGSDWSSWDGVTVDPRTR